VKVRVIISAMRRDGWYLDHQAGSHRKFRHPVKPNRIIIAWADDVDLKPKEAARLLREAGL
jgi:predicted RNA binding protein YcfA (HicA-like mRNA interferase family)